MATQRFALASHSHSQHKVYRCLSMLRSVMSYVAREARSSSYVSDITTVEIVGHRVHGHADEILRVHKITFVHGERCITGVCLSLLSLKAEKTKSRH